MSGELRFLEGDDQDARVEAEGGKGFRLLRGFLLVAIGAFIGIALLSRSGTQPVAEVVALAGGPGPFVDRALQHAREGEPERGLHLAEMALATDPDHPAALRARLEALESLLDRSADVNHYEVEWLKHRISETRDALGE